MLRFVSKILGSARFFPAALCCGFLAGLIGLIYLYSVDAPLIMIFINGCALLIAMLLSLLLRFTLVLDRKSLLVIAGTSALILMATAVGGHGIEGANRWFAIGPFVVQPSLILLPLIAICYARKSGSWTSLAVIVSALSMAIQPDRAMAGMLFLSMLVLCIGQRTQNHFAVTIICAVTFATTMVIPDRLTAVRFVDHILWTAFDINIFLGLALWMGSILLLLPALFAYRRKPESASLVFAASWFAIISAAAMGAYPTPIVGYGASSILGYFLSLLIVERAGQSVSIEHEKGFETKAQNESVRNDFLPASS